MQPSLVASSSARAMLAAFDSLGLDAAAIQREARLTDAMLDDPDGRLPASKVYRMWEAADRRWRRPALGLLAGAAVPVGAYDAIDYLVLTAPTLGEGLTALAGAFAIVTSELRYRIRYEGTSVACVLEWASPPAGIMAHLRDYSLAAVARRARTASEVAPSRIEIAGPPLTTAAHYGDVLGAPVRLHAHRDAVVFGACAWRAPSLRADAHLHRTLTRHVELLLERHARGGHDDLPDRVRAVLRAGPGAVPMPEVARRLGVSVRSLQRRLHAEGTSFAGLVDEIRAALARDALCDRRLSVSEIACRLGFSEPSAFSRAFRRWTGQSPRAFRAARTAPAAARGDSRPDPPIG